jgi:enoyl-CoA hydratase/carnithine racemase
MNERSFTDLEYHTDGAVVELILDREEVYNAIRHETLHDFEAARERAEADDDISCILIRSKGSNSFSAGADLGVLDEYLDNSDDLASWLKDWDAAFGGLARSDLVVLTCVTGQALAGGLEIVLASDLCVTGEMAEFGDQHINFNLVAGGGGTQLLPRIIGPRRAKYLILTGAKIDAKQAQRWGLVNKVCETPVDESRKLAKNIAGHNQTSLSRAKNLVNRSMNTSLEEGLELERQTVLNHLSSSVARDGIDDFQDR